MGRGEGGLWGTMCSPFLLFGSFRSGCSPRRDRSRTVSVLSASGSKQTSPKWVRSETGSGQGLRSELDSAFMRNGLKLASARHRFGEKQFRFVSVRDGLSPKWFRSETVSLLGPKRYWPETCSETRSARKGFGPAWVWFEVDADRNKLDSKRVVTDSDKNGLSAYLFVGDSFRGEFSPRGESSETS